MKLRNSKNVKVQIEIPASALLSHIHMVNVQKALHVSKGDLSI